MFVVRVENDEATVFRAFRRIQLARAWASQRNSDEPNCLVDIFEAAGADDAAAAVASTRYGRSRSLSSGDVVMALLPPMPPASDIAFGRRTA